MKLSDNADKSFFLEIGKFCKKFLPVIKYTELFCLAYYFELRNMCIEGTTDKQLIATLVCYAHDRNRKILVAVEI